MPLRHGQRLVAPDRAKHFCSVASKAVAHQRRMAVARDLVEDHARDFDIVAIARKAECYGGGGLRLTGNVDHQHHRPSGRGGDIGGRAIAPGAGQGDAVEQAHHALGKREVGIIGGAAAAHRTGRDACAQESRLNEARPAAIAWKAGSI